MKTKLIFVLLWFIGVVPTGISQIQVSTPDTVVDQGTYVLIPIMVSDLTGMNVISYQFDLRYNNLVITPIEINRENTLSASWSNMYYNFNTPGLLTIAAFDVIPLLGRGRLIQILFEVKGSPGNSSDLIFDYFEFSGNTNGIVRNNGRIRVNLNQVNVILTSNFPGVTQLVVDDTMRNTPYAAQWVRGSIHQIAAPSPQNIGDGTRCLFDSWSDGGVQSHQVSTQVDMNFTANFSKQFYLHIISANGNPQGEGWYNSAAVAHFSVESDVAQGEYTRHQFQSWSGTGQNSYTGSNREATVTMLNPVTEQANWKTEYYLKVNSPYGHPHGEGWYWGGSMANFGIDSTTIEKLTEKHQFISWTGSGNGSYTGNASQANTVINNPVIETANWDTDYYVGLKTDPPDLMIIPGSGWYNSGHLLTTIQAPEFIHKGSIEYIFKEWSVNGGPVPGNPATVTVNGSLIIVARYHRLIDATVTTSVAFGTCVIVDDTTYEAPYSTIWTFGEPHTISVDEYQAGLPGMRYKFISWDIGEDRTQVVSPDSDRTYIASLEIQYSLALITQPMNLIAFQYDLWHPEGESVVLPEAPRSTKIDTQIYRFTNWSEKNQVIDGNPIIIQMDEPKIITAYYDNASSLSGTIHTGDGPLAGVRMILSGSEIDTVYSEITGAYQFDALFFGDYELVPQKEGFRFIPDHIEYFTLQKNQTDQNFLAFDTLTAVTDESGDAVPAECVLAQNYPNPFNGGTEICYRLPEKVHISLRIYNLLGQPVRNLASQEQGPGDFTILWDGSNDSHQQLPSGIYVYQLRYDRLVLTRKMVKLE